MGRKTISDSRVTDILLEDLCNRTNGPLTQGEIADYIGCSRQYITHIEHNVKLHLERVLNDNLPSTYNSDILSGLNEG